MSAAVLPLGLLAGLAGLLGLLVGSFVNVVVHRVPAGLSVVRPRSACPACGHEVRERDNVPVVSWLLLRGRCRDCRTPIPVRYPAVEASTAVLFALVALAETRPPVLVALLVVAGAGVALALIDVEHGRLPFAVTGTAALLAGAVLLSGWVGVLVLDGPSAAGSALVGPLVGVLAWGGVYAALWALTSGRGMGLGDVALAPVLGLVLGAVGAPAAVVGLALGFALGALGAVALLALGLVRRGTRIPFGPFMLAGAAGGLFAGDPLAAAYLRLVGLA